MTNARRKAGSYERALGRGSSVAPFTARGSNRSFISFIGLSSIGLSSSRSREPGQADLSGVCVFLAPTCTGTVGLEP